MDLFRASSGLWAWSGRKKTRGWGGGFVSAGVEKQKKKKLHTNTTRTTIAAIRIYLYTYIGRRRQQSLSAPSSVSAGEIRKIPQRDADTAFPSLPRRVAAAAVYIPLGLQYVFRLPVRRVYYLPGCCCCSCTRALSPAVLSCNIIYNILCTVCVCVVLFVYSRTVYTTLYYTCVYVCLGTYNNMIIIRARECEE